MRAVETFTVVVMLLAADVRGLAQTAGTLPESDLATVGYPSVEAALKALHQKPGVTFRSQNGWLIAEEDGAHAIWSFAPEGHPAYPTVVKRAVVIEHGVTNIQMDVHCEADKIACDNVVIQFQQLNERISGAVRNKADTPLVFAGIPPEEINITTDSAPGWLPSADQRAQVVSVIHEFLTALDNGDPTKAFALMTNGQKAIQTFEQFAKRLAEFNAGAGPVKERRIVKITWTKDPAAAPARGIYAAIDLVSHFANIDRHCGYIVLYQPDSLASFRVARQEDGFITNEQVRQIERAQSPEAVEVLWAQIARKCPNYSVGTPDFK
ncbi:MAG: DUF4019 domain-containing protein [Steroidobacteraceae bacterium]